ncbi:hypothetical protein PVAP13_3KG508600 [Panicum virgatum]|uniref:Uncharacterized protein n=1 Tax=Panicum virgatum TaxID=38727 RepID=A0A8T0V6F6_PANVG|nr:hypothetical protein PVAP13_3KG508600 [Panicum virgatum]
MLPRRAAIAGVLPPVPRLAAYPVGDEPAEPLGGARRVPPPPLPHLLGDGLLLLPGQALQHRLERRAGALAALQRRPHYAPVAGVVVLEELPALPAREQLLHRSGEAAAAGGEQQLLRARHRVHQRRVVGAEHPHLPELAEQLVVPGARRRGAGAFAAVRGAPAWLLLVAETVVAGVEDRGLAAADAAAVVGAGLLGPAPRGVVVVVVAVAMAPRDAGAFADAERVAPAVAIVGVPLLLDGCARDVTIELAPRRGPGARALTGAQGGAVGGRYLPAGGGGPALLPRQATRLVRLPLLQPREERAGELPEQAVVCRAERFPDAGVDLVGVRVAGVQHGEELAQDLGARFFLHPALEREALSEPGVVARAGAGRSALEGQRVADARHVRPRLRRHGPAPAAPSAPARAAPPRPRRGDAFRGDRDGSPRPAEEGGEPVEHVGVFPEEPRRAGPDEARVDAALSESAEEAEQLVPDARIPHEPRLDLPEEGDGLGDLRHRVPHHGRRLARRRLLLVPQGFLLGHDAGEEIKPSRWNNDPVGK